jgi:hypothetical protein
MCKKFLNSVLKKYFFPLLEPPVYCSLDFFIRIEVLGPEVFLQFGEKVKISGSDIWAVGWMW